MITCQICKRSLKFINNTHLKSHKLSAQEYLAQFPDAKLVSEETSQKYSLNSKKQNAIRDYSGIGIKISETKKKKFASGELIQWNKGIAMSEEQKQKLSDIAKAAFASGERISYNLGKTLSEEIRRKISETCKGYKLTNEQLQNLIKAQRERASSPDYVNPMKDKKFTEEQCRKVGDATLRNYDKIRATMEAKGHWIPLDKIDEFTLYKRFVWMETNKNVHLIPNYDVDKRGLCRRGSDNYQVDHIVSITDGFKNGVDPTIIGNISNLRFIPWMKNLQKFDRSDMSIEELYEIFEGIL